ncbi:MAG: GspE/PulE family protein [Candidatus Gracilibacteria bacterium]
MALLITDLKKKLLELSLLDEKQLQVAEEHAVKAEQALEDYLFDSDTIPDTDLGKVVAGLYGVPFVKLSEKTISDKLLPIIPYSLASYQSVIPFEQVDHELHVATSKPGNYELFSFIENKTGLDLKISFATEKDIKAALKAYNRDVNEKFAKLLQGALDDPSKIESLKETSKIVDSIILFAYQNNASDIHLEPQKRFLNVRYRIDGILSTIAELPLEITDLVVTRIKVLSNLRTDEHRAAQDGRFKIDLEGTEITLRVSIVPIYEGEKVVMRLLTSTNQSLNLEAFGYTSRNLELIRTNILKTNGIILMTGPTGSGKTTTLYTILNLLNSPEVNISTIEDPIEYRMEGINQIQVNPKTNLTFADGLRALLRQDPDIVMVGEIRDAETAGIAINAALTGHLVLATLHTNDAATTLPRMLEMDIESFLLAATVKMIIAQRLVRKICESCKTSYTIDIKKVESMSKKFNIRQDIKSIFEKLNPDKQEFTLYKGTGCPLCNNSGYKGRTSISEVMEISPDIQKTILDNETPKIIEEIARKEGMTTLFEDGMLKVLNGVTTLEEVLRVMRS